MKINSINNYQSFKGKPPVLNTSEQIAKYLKKRQSVQLADVFITGGAFYSGLLTIITGGIGIVARNNDLINKAFLMGGITIGTLLTSLSFSIKSRKMQKIANAAIEKIKRKNAQKIADEELKLFRLSKKSHKSHSRAISRRLKLENKMNEG